MEAVWHEAGPDSRITPDGSLRVEHRLGSLQWHGQTIHDRWVVVTETSSGAVVVDCRKWPRSRSYIDAEGLIHLRLSLAVSGSDALFVVDPRRRTFRDLSQSGPERPLAEMQQTIDGALPELRQWMAGTGWEQRACYISPDGSLRVEESIVDNERAPMLRTVKAFDTATGDALLDLDEADIYAMFRTWEGESAALIGVRRLGHFDMFDVTLDAAKGTWRMGDMPESGLGAETRPEILARLEAAHKASARRAAHGAGEIGERLTRLAALLFGLLCGGALVALYDAAFGPVLGGIGL